MRGGRVSSLDTLFVQVEKMMRDTAYDVVEVRYDSLYGYPREVTLDPSILVRDNEVRRTVGALTVLQTVPPRRSQKKVRAAKP